MRWRRAREWIDPNPPFARVLSRGITRELTPKGYNLPPLRGSDLIARSNQINFFCLKRSLGAVADF